MTNARPKKTETGPATRDASCAKITDSVSWREPVDASDAIAIQQELRQQVTLENQLGPLNIIAGVDVSYDIATNLTRAYIVLFDAHSHEILKSVRAIAPTTFPYVPGLLSFREIPALLKAFSCLSEKPDLLMVDGQGVAHPRRLGIAAHLGVLLDIPALGIAKKRLCGRYEEPGDEKGSHTLLMDKGERIGTVYRSKERCNPLFISAGHRIDQDTAFVLVQDWMGKYRLPEPTRITDHISKWPV